MQIKLRTCNIHCISLYSFRLAGRTLLHHPYQTEETGFSRRAIGQR